MVSCRHCGKQGDPRFEIAPYYFDGIHAWLHIERCCDEWHAKARAWRAEHPRKPKVAAPVDDQEPVPSWVEQEAGG